MTPEKDAIMKSPHTDSGRRWQGALALLLILFLVATATSMILAGKRVSRVVDRDYYDHGLHYGEEVPSSKGDATGWTMTTSFSKGELAVEVRDRDRRAVPGGSLTFQPLQVGGTPAPKLLLAEVAPGRYLCAGAGKGAGGKGVLRFTKGGASIQNNVVLFP